MIASTLAEKAEQCDLSRERVRQIEGARAPSLRNPGSDHRLRALTSIQLRELPEICPLERRPPQLLPTPPMRPAFDQLSYQANWAHRRKAASAIVENRATLG
jgi:hypothetical protein